MLIVQFDGPPSWSLDTNETGERTKCPWVRVLGLIAWGEVSTAVGPPPPLPTGIFYPHLGSHGKIGDCEQSNSHTPLGAMSSRPPQRKRANADGSQAHNTHRENTCTSG